MSEMRALNDILGGMFGLLGLSVLLYPDRSPIATQMYILGSIMVLVRNFFYCFSTQQQGRARTRTAKLNGGPKPPAPGSRPPTPQPKKIGAEKE